MTYREKAINILIKKLHVNQHEAEHIIMHLERDMGYKPCVIGVLNAPKEINDWDAKVVKTRKEI